MKKEKKSPTKRNRTTIIWVGATLFITLIGITILGYSCFTELKRELAVIGQSQLNLIK